MSTFDPYATVAWLVAAFIALGSYVLFQREVARRQITEGDLRDREAQLRGAMHGSTDGVFMLRAVRNAAGTIEDFECTDVNPTGAALLKLPREALIGMRSSAAPNARCSSSLIADYVQAIETGTSVISEMRVSQRRFATGWLWHQAVPVAGGIAITIRDIAAAKKEEETLRRASITDDLTGLYNRRGFLTLADQQLRVSRRQGRDLVLFFADLDAFKQVNDRFGHAAGDKSLKAVASLLRASVRDSDIVARLGGDEFTILALDGDDNAASLITRRINQRIANINARSELSAPLSLSVGHVRVRASETKSLDELLANADRLLYKRKAQRSVESDSSNVSTISSSVGPSSNRLHQGRESSNLRNVRTT